MQRLAHETWDDVRASGGKRVTLDALHTTLARLLAEQETLFEAVWQRLTLAQRAVLRAVVLQNGQGLLSADVRARYRLGGPSSIQTSLAALLKQDLVLKEAIELRRRRLAPSRMDRAENLLSGDGAGLLARIGLHRPELRAWAMYDWANSAFQTTVITAVFPRFFSDYAAAGLSPTEATARFAWATTIAVTITAVIGPILGAIADIRGLKKTLLGVSMSVGIVATLLMATISRGDWMYAATVFMVANIGIAASFVFYDSLLPHIAAPDEMDRVSTAAYAIGYLGGGVLLVVNLVWILAPTRSGSPIPSRPSACRSSASLCGGCSSHCHCSFASPNRRRGSNRHESRGDNSIRVAFVRLWGDLPRAARLSSGLPDARRVPALQRRHPDDYPHGVDLRRRSRHRPERADRGVRARAVRRRAVLVSVRRHGRLALAPSRVSSWRLRSTPGSACLATS